ncbi:MAG TPA: LanC-like protein [Gaiellaceae bacterium]|nr:LanC-like protein [Gaiellaceae bacterium]
MAELFRPSEHEPLAAGEWDEARAEEAIASIVADAEAAFDGERWPWHPDDGVDDAWNSLYMGSAGAAWALHEVGSTGWEDAAVSFVDRFRTQPLREEDAVETSYHFGELGIALVAFRLTGDGGLADRIHELVLAGLDPEANEVMYGTPGSLLAAEAMLAWTGDQRWDEAWRAAAARVEAMRDPDGLWTSRLAGHAARYLGPAHGYAGNIRALANRRPVQLADLSPYLLREDGLANWLPGDGSRPDEIRVQWCHGAPGMVTTLGDLLDLELAVAGGELTWRAGPLAKGPGLCHGTAGNAYAFLVLHHRTGDELWRDRARAFAMHAIGQVERDRTAAGRGRYSLFTGDLGVALFLRHLLHGEYRFPTMGPFGALPEP